MYEVDARGCYTHKDLPDGRHACVVPLTYGRARVVVSDNTDHIEYLDEW